MDTRERGRCRAWGSETSDGTGAGPLMRHEEREEMTGRLVGGGPTTGQLTERTHG